MRLWGNNASIALTSSFSASANSGAAKSNPLILCSPISHGPHPQRLQCALGGLPARHNTSLHGGGGGITSLPLFGFF